MYKRFLKQQIIPGMKKGCNYPYDSMVFLRLFFADRRHWCYGKSCTQNL